MYILWCSVTAVLLVANAKGAILSDCSDVNTKLIPECDGSVLYGEGVCGENVCAQQLGEICHFDLLRWPGPEAKPPRCEPGLECEAAPGFGIKGWNLWAGRGTCRENN